MGPKVVLSRVRTAPEDDIGQGVARIFNSFVTPLRKNQKDRFQRGDYVALINRVTGDKIVRVVVGSGHTDCRKNEVLLDYESRIRLGIHKRAQREEADVLVRQAGRLEVFSRYWNHESRAERFAMRRDTISVGLGFLGAVLGGIGLYVAMI